MSDIDIQIVNFNHSFSDIEKIRTTVFIKEQHVPSELEWDEFDAGSIHILAYYKNNAVATARLLPDGHIGRMAVLAEFRKRHIGKKMLNFLLNLAQKKLITKIQLSAQEHAVEFYKKMGFSITSDMYLDAGIEHYDMEYTEADSGHRDD